MKKRVLALLLACTMVFSLTACGSKEENTTETENTATEETTETTESTETEDTTETTE